MTQTPPMILLIDYIQSFFVGFINLILRLFTSACEDKVRQAVQDGRKKIFSFYSLFQKILTPIPLPYMA